MQNSDIHPEYDYWARHKAAGLPELLAPAGSLAHLKAAVRAGADAVYIGGQRFGARAYAKNLSADDCSDALHFAHFHGRKVFLTINTLMKEDEINQILYDFLKPYYEAGLDGVIVQDLGTASFVHRNFPDMEIHASTQMTITHAAGAFAAGKMGITRIVPARELSLEELSKIKRESGLELEVFVHGALCFCYSGQCLLSSWYGKRSGNRGCCAQPCRLPYMNGSGQEAHYLSPRDLCSVRMLPQLVDAGVDSLKIEGRMKNVDYVAGVTSVYRRYLDLYGELKKEGHPERYQVSEQDYHILKELYCRGNFTEGYWRRHNGPEMMAVNTQKNLGRRIGQIKSVGKHSILVRLLDRVHPGDILVIPAGINRETVLTVPLIPGTGGSITLNVPDGKCLSPSMPVFRRRNELLSRRLQEEVIERRLCYPVKGQVTICQGTSSRVALTCRGVSITIEGPAAETAVKKALLKEDVVKQFQKTGETPFSLKALSVELQENSFLPLSVLKGLRRDAYRALADKIATFGDRVRVMESCPKTDKNSLGDRETTKERIAVVYDMPLLDKCLSLGFYTSICLPVDAWNPDELIVQNKRIIQSGKKPLLSLPSVMRHGRDQWEEICCQAVWDSIYVHNINEACWLAQLDRFKGKRIAAASFYQWNRESLAASKRIAGINGFQLPVELTLDECAGLLSSGLSAELIIYGHVPLMVSAQCQKKMAGRCDHRNEALWLSDRRKRKLLVSTHCDFCYNKIWSHEPGNLIGEDLGKNVGAVSRFTFDFYLADRQVPEKLLDRFLWWEERGYS